MNTMFTLNIQQKLETYTVGRGSVGPLHLIVQASGTFDVEHCLHVSPSQNLLTGNDEAYENRHVSRLTRIIYRQICKDRLITRQRVKSETYTHRETKDLYRRDNEHKADSVHMKLIG
jgi:hypothetical protein